MPLNFKQSMAPRSAFAKLGAGAALSYIIVSLMLLASFYYFIMDISKKNQKTFNDISLWWGICSSCVAIMIFASSQIPSLLQPSAMACGMTLMSSSIICMITSCISSIT